MKTKNVQTAKSNQNSRHISKKSEVSLSAFLKELTEKTGGEVTRSTLITPETVSRYKSRTRNDVGH
jgi:hypothetical protein